MYIESSFKKIIFLVCCWGFEISGNQIHNLMMSHLSKRLTKGHISKARFCWLFNKSRISLVDLADPKCSYIICLEIQPQSFVKINKYGLLQQSFGAKAVLKFFVKCRKCPKHFCMHEKSYPLNLLKSSPNRLFNSMARVFF